MFHRGCDRSLVGARMIWTGFANGIVLRTCPLQVARGSVILDVPFYACFGC